MATRFVSQSGGLFSGGSACNGQTAISVATFNGTSQSAGDINWLCGTITAALTPSGSGASGNVVSIKFDSGAGMSFAAVPSSGAIVLTGLSHYLIDGGGGSCGYISNSNATCSNGYIKSTANGSGLANQTASVAIEAGSTTDIEIKGLVLGPIYTHTSTSDLTQSPPGPIAVHFVGATSMNIHNNTIHDCAWCINGNAAGLTIQANEIYNSDHGVGIGGNNSTVLINANHFHDWVNWDTTNNSFHHDGIHEFDNPGTTINGSTISNNLFDGDQGNNLTAAIYIEKSSPTGTHQNVTVFNNVVIAASTRFSNVGWISAWNTTGAPTTDQGATVSFYNNTVFGYYSQGNGSCFAVEGWTGLTFENNVLVNCQNLIGINTGTTVTSMDYNAYQNLTSDEPCGTNCNTFTWFGAVDFASFTTWKTDCSCDSHARFDTLSTINLGAGGRQKSGSTLISNGTNLTSLSITALDSDILGDARPSGATAWDIGAYFGAASTSTFATFVSTIYP